MKFLLSMSLLFLVSTSFTQNDVNWIGGTPGLENAWNEPRNWSKYRVPDAFSDVIIPDVSTTTRAYPHIPQGMVVELSSLLITSGANLSLEQGAQLIIHEYQFGLENEHLNILGSIIIRPGDAAENAIGLTPEPGTASDTIPTRKFRE